MVKIVTFCLLNKQLSCGVLLHPGMCACMCLIGVYFPWCKQQWSHLQLVFFSVLRFWGELLQSLKGHSRWSGDRFACRFSFSPVKTVVKCLLSEKMTPEEVLRGIISRVGLEATNLYVLKVNLSPLLFCFLIYIDCYWYRYKSQFIYSRYTNWMHIQTINNRPW